MQNRRTFFIFAVVAAVVLLVIDGRQAQAQCSWGTGTTESCGNVGIYAASPDRALQIGTTGTWSGTSGLLLKGSNPGIEFADTEANPQHWLMGNGVNTPNDGKLSLAHDFNVGLPRLVVLPVTGYLGINTSHPGTAVQVGGENVGYSSHKENQIQVYGFAQNSDGDVPFADLWLANAPSQDWAQQSLGGGGVKFQASHYTDNYGAKLDILLGNPATYGGAPNNLTNRMTILGNGNVGIGTSAPGYTLDVAGTIHATNVIGASFQDVAEWVPASIEMTAGTVVVLNPEKTNEVMPSASAYDSTVAGVVSAKPGIILGEPSAEKVQVATTGRVRVKVDASKEPIKIGDLLVTSDEPGTAMKSIPMEIKGRRVHQPGTIIGKALEPLASGRGEVLVLLSLQ
jgi:hypothetical protein